MFINIWMGKQNVEYTYNGILFSLKKEGNSVTCYNVDEPWGHYAKWNKPATWRQILLWFHLYEISKFIETESRMVVTRGWGKWEKKSCFMGTKFQICKMKKFWRSVSQECEFTEWYWTIHLKMVKMVNFMLCVFFCHKKMS